MLRRSAAPFILRVICSDGWGDLCEKKEDANRSIQAPASLEEILVTLACFY
jgi:hypothetical protein